MLAAISTISNASSNKVISYLWCIFFLITVTRLSCLNVKTNCFMFRRKLKLNQFSQIWMFVNLARLVQLCQVSLVSQVRLIKLGQERRLVQTSQYVSYVRYYYIGGPKLGQLGQVFQARLLRLGQKGQFSQARLVRLGQASQVRVVWLGQVSQANQANQISKIMLV